MQDSKQAINKWDIRTMFTDADVIFSYTRAQAIQDGTLVAIDPKLAREAGFVVPVALTEAAWHDCVTWSREDTQRTGTPQDEVGRLWDVLWMAARSGRQQEGQMISFTVYRVPRSTRTGSPQPVELIAHIGPGDDHEPVITIGFAIDF